MTRIFIVAGEASGDKLGEAVMRGLKALAPEVEFAGVGGPLMQAEGFTSLFSMEELSVMGLSEVLPKYRGLVRRKDETVRAALDFSPDVLLTIDSPDFCKRVAREVKAARPGIRTVHYVAPSVWAWRPKRAQKMAAYIDQVLTLLPFEPPYMQAAGMRADFVGHPVVAEQRPTLERIRSYRADQGLGDAPVLLLLPGSRMGEVRRLSERFGAAAERVRQVRPELRCVVIVADAVKDWLEAHRGLFPENTVFISPRDGDEKRAAFAASSVALAASGTVSLELAAANVPMVIGYDMAWLSRMILPRLMKIDTFTLVNLVSEMQAVPEFIGKACRAESMAQAVLEAYADPDAQLGAMELTMDRLGQGGEAPGLRAARAVLEPL